MVLKSNYQHCGIPWLNECYFLKYNSIFAYVRFVSVGHSQIYKPCNKVNFELRPVLYVAFQSRPMQFKQ